MSILCSLDNVLIQVGAVLTATLLSTAVKIAHKDFRDCVWSPLRCRSVEAYFTVLSLDNAVQDLIIQLHCTKWIIIAHAQLSRVCEMTILCAI